MKYSFHLLFVILFLSCDAVQVEDLLGDFSDENSPLTTINTTDATYNSSSVSFSWIGNEFANSFSYRLEPLSYIDTVKTYISWSEWDTVNMVTLTNLDDGSYNFYIKSRYTIENVEIPHSVNFIVNAIGKVNDIGGTALRVYPLFQQVSLGESFNVYIYIEDVEELGGMELHLSYPSSNESVSLSPGSILSNAPIFFDTINIANGTIELIATTIIPTAEDSVGYTGTGILAKINLTSSISGSVDTLYIQDSSILKNSGNIEIDVLEKVYGLIEVVE